MRVLAEEYVGYGIKGSKDVWIDGNVACLVFSRSWKTARLRIDKVSH